VLSFEVKLSFDTPSKIYNGYFRRLKPSATIRDREVICIEDKEIFSVFYFVRIYGNGFGWFLSFFIGG
jgi:hypothetical protein